jgi:hypothetical protein
MRKLAVALFAVLAIAVIAAGCGGGGDSTAAESEAASGGSESGGAAPSKAAFIKEGDSVCSKAELQLSKEIIAFAKENGIDIEGEEEPTKDQQTEMYEQIVLPNIAGQAERLEALTPPKGDEETVEDITSTLTREVEEAEEHPDDLGEDPLKEASAKAQAYGLTSCGS